MISDLVNLFIINVTIAENSSYEHPLLRFNATLPELHREASESLQGLAYALIIRKAKVQQLERRGQIIVARLFDTLLSDPEKLFYLASWQNGCTESTIERRVCDYVSRMTVSYAERIYKRLFNPGFEGSGDEL